MNENKEKIPQSEDEVVTESEVMQKEFEFKAHGCQYRQRGPYLVCISCEVQHAIYIGMEKIMVGEDTDGTPIIEKRDKHR